MQYFWIFILSYSLVLNLPQFSEVLMSFRVISLSSHLKIFQWLIFITGHLSDVYHLCTINDQNTCKKNFSNFIYEYPWSGKINGLFHSHNRNKVCPQTLQAHLKTSMIFMQLDIELKRNLYMYTLEDIICLLIPREIIQLVCFWWVSAYLLNRHEALALCVNSHFAR